jgi:hypothetical protein
MRKIEEQLLNKREREKEACELKARQNEPDGNDFCYRMEK